MNSRLVRSFSFLLLAATAVPASALGKYSIIDLGGSGTTAYGINNAGQVVGSFTPTPGGSDNAFLYSGGVRPNLGLLGGSSAAATAINASGQIAGGYRTSGAGVTPYRAFELTGGVKTNLETTGNSYAWGINDSGAAAGVFNGTATLWSGGSRVSTGISGTAYDINNSGQAVITSTSNQAYLYSGGVATPLGALGGSVAFGFALNNAGTVVGSAYLAGNTITHAYKYSGGTMTDIGVLNPGDISEAHAINSSGMIVGLSGQFGTNAFVYDGTTMFNLNGLLDPAAVLAGWNLQNAVGINDSGQIIGQGSLNGISHSFLLTPLAPVPEPGTYAALALGVVALLKRRK